MSRFAPEMLLHVAQLVQAQDIPGLRHTFAELSAHTRGQWMNDCRALGSDGTGATSLVLSEEQIRHTERLLVARAWDVFDVQRQHRDLPSLTQALDDALNHLDTPLAPWEAQFLVYQCWFGDLQGIPEGHTEPLCARMLPLMALEDSQALVQRLNVFPRQPAEHDWTLATLATLPAEEQRQCAKRITQRLYSMSSPSSTGEWKAQRDNRVAAYQQAQEQLRERTGEWLQHWCDLMPPGQHHLPVAQLLRDVVQEKLLSLSSPANQVAVQATTQRVLALMDTSPETVFSASLSDPLMHAFMDEWSMTQTPATQRACAAALLEHLSSDRQGAFPRLMALHRLSTTLEATEPPRPQRRWRRS